MAPRPALFLLALAIASCGRKDDITETVDHNGSIESSISVQHIDSTRDVVLTIHKVWVNGQLANTIAHRDTIPGLGSISTDAEKNNGDTQPVTVPKDYEIFITMK
jgi:hypothetical protein